MAPTEAALASLLSLPWEIRSVILLNVLKPQRRREPVFDATFIKKRVWLRNCFDETNPKTTTLFIEKPGTWPLARSARALQATNRQLREEVMLLINETFKTGKAKALFILDIMIVKDVGIFPTWLSFPYKTKRILSLRVNLRIVRPDPRTVPREWIEAARYPGKISPRTLQLEIPTFWSFFAALALISLSRLRYKPAVDKPGTQSTAELPNILQGGTQRHRSSVMDAYLVPIEETPYVVDQLHIDYKPTEYRPNGKCIVPGVEDKSRDGPFYKEGYVQFGREVFHDNTDYTGYWETYELLMQAKAAGKIASCQLLEHVSEALTSITQYQKEQDGMALYQYALANNVGEVTYSPPFGNDAYMMSKDTATWVSVYESDGDWRTMNISKAIAKEEAREDPARGYIASLQLAKRRRALGWQAQFDKGSEKI